jgi:CopY/TcrY family copper transport repressor
MRKDCEMELNISDAEMKVMRVIWSLGQATVANVETQIADSTGWSLATIKTLLGRLVKKGMLSTEKDGRCFIYRATMTECDAISLMSNELLGKVCETKQSQLLGDLIERSHLTAADLANLQALLAQKETVESVQCSCLKDFAVCTCKHVHESEMVQA